jgi:hypothetical protein
VKAAPAATWIACNGDSGMGESSKSQWNSPSVIGT